MELKFSSNPRLRDNFRYVILIIFILNYCLFAQPYTDSLLFFYSPDCRHCEFFLKEFLPKIERDYRIAVKTFNIEIARNMYLLEGLEAKLKNIGDELPVIFYRDLVVYGTDSILKKLPAIIDHYRAESLIYIAYFTKPSCRECSRVDRIIKILTREEKNIVVKTYNINIKDNKLLAEAISERIGVPERFRLLVPAIFVGRDYLIKDNIRLTELKDILRKYHAGTENFELLNPAIKAQSEEAICNRFAQIGFWGVIGAGLLDGINPCAFATILFFISYLVLLGRKQRDIILMGLFFSLAVFLTYFLIGLGYLQFLDYLTRFRPISKFIFAGFGILTIILGLLNIYDFLQARTGRLDRMKLQLPDYIKIQIHKSIKAQTRIFGIVLGAFGAGLFVSILEFACTGQVYIPTITFVVSNPQLKIRAITFLTLYNIMFIFPLVIITGVGSIVSTDRVGKFLKARIGTIKVMTALFFITLGILLIILSS